MRPNSANSDSGWQQHTGTRYAPPLVMSGQKWSIHLANDTTEQRNVVTNTRVQVKRVQWADWYGGNIVTDSTDMEHAPKRARTPAYSIWVTVTPSHHPSFTPEYHPRFTPQNRNLRNVDTVNPWTLITIYIITSRQASLVLGECKPVKGPTARI